MIRSLLCFRVGRWIEALVLAAIITFASIAVPEWVFRKLWLSRWHPAVVQYLGWGTVYDLLLLWFGLLLVAGAPRRSGLRIGRIGAHWRGVLAVVAVPLVLTALVYPRLAVRPFAGQSASMWLISPLAQDLVFIGYLYGRFETLGRQRLHPRIAITVALLVTSAFFASWHFQNFAAMPAGYVCFQLVYVFVGTVWTGITRVLTGSILYATFVHMGANFIAWYWS